MEFKGSKEDWWNSHGEIMTGVHGKVGRIYEQSSIDRTETRANINLVLNSRKLLEMLAEIHQAMCEGEANDKHLRKRVEKLIKETIKI